MNYKDSKEILELIKKSKRILLTLHSSPDPDSAGASLALYDVLKKLGKEDTEVVCFDKVPSYMILTKKSPIKEVFDISKFDFSKFDLYIALDTQQLALLTSTREKVKLPSKLKVIVIDHHITNPKYGNINLVDGEKSSTSEIIYDLFQDWEVSISKNIASNILLGIIGDTGGFRYPGTTVRTFEIVTQLIKRGAQKDEIIFKQYSNNEFGTLKYWGLVLRKMKIDKKHKFVYFAIPYEEFQKYANYGAGASHGIDVFTNSVVGTDFGIAITGKKKGWLSVNLRSRTGFDVSKIAVALGIGGGGHRYAAGAKMKSPFKEGVEKVLRVAREMSNA